MNQKLKQKYIDLYHEKRVECKKHQPRFPKGISDKIKHGKFLRTERVSIFDIDTHVLDEIQQFFDSDDRIEEVERILRDYFTYPANLIIIDVNEDLELIDGWHRLFMSHFNYIVLNHEKCEKIRVRIYENS